MATKASQKDKKSQSDMIVETARELEADEDEAWWEKRPKKVAERKPDPKNES